uniref:Protocadherin 12 n=1 Tax=Sphenodon punctatus TaxID=8508 RepID=A0A8D0G317_SPHPU
MLLLLPLHFLLHFPTLWLSGDCQEVATFTVHYRVPEEVPRGTVLGNLPEELGWTETSEATGTFLLLQSPWVLPIQVGSGNGSLSTTGRLDREFFCSLKDPCVISFSVLAAKHAALIHLEIHILDINDNGPQFPQTMLELEISESASLRTRIPLDRALDLDTGLNALCSYSLSPSEHFDLEAISGSDGNQHAELVVVREVDRERHSCFDLVLTAVDHGEPPRSGSTLVKVTVLDSNDNSPVFAQSSTTMEIWEDVLPGTLLINLTATDPDQGPNGEIEYSFSKHVSAQVLNTFTIDGQTGRVLLRQLLDYEENPFYEVDVQARDRGPNPVPAHCKLLVQVLDVNDNAPKVHVTWAAQAAVVSEALPKDSFVALITVSDPDSGRNGQVDCYLWEGAEHFTLKRTNAGNYMLLTRTSLDRESWAEHNLTLLVRDRGSPPLDVSKHLTIHITDVNDNPPCFERDLYRISIAENNQPSSYLTAVRAHDTDAGLNGKVTYSIQNPWASGLVSVKADTGEIFALSAFDAEQMTSLEFFVMAEDGGHPRLSTNVSVRVTVLDVNDNAPVVTQPVLEGDRANITVLVNADTGYPVAPEGTAGSNPTPFANAHLLFTVTASDLDKGLNGAVLYDILSGNEAGLFILDHQSGQLFLNCSDASSLVGHEWELELSVRDQGEVPLHTEVHAKVIFKTHCEPVPESASTSQPLSPSAVTGICLVGLLAISLVSVGLTMSLCRREKHNNMAYNCREAEHAYSQQQPKKPPKPIQKADIHIVPVLRRGEAKQPQAWPETPPETAWVEAMGVPCHLTPNLYRTLRNQGNQNSLIGQSEAFAFPTIQRRPFHPQRPRNLNLQDALPPAICLSMDPSSDSAPECQESASPEAGPGEAHCRRYILRSLVRLSMAALAEQGPAGQLPMESAPVQQISQLLSLLHQGQVQPKPNHRGNKYTAKHGSRNASLDTESLNTKDGDNMHHSGGDDLEVLGEELGNLLDPPSGLALEQLTVADPAWMARLSLTLSTDYKDNVVSPGSLLSAHSQEAPDRDEPHTFETFGKGSGCESSTAGPKLASMFLTEMSTLFEMILAQKTGTHMDPRSGILRQLSTRSKALGLDGEALGAAESNAVGSSGSFRMAGRTGGCKRDM